MTPSGAVTQAVHELVRRDFRHVFGQPQVNARPDPVWRAVRAAGTRLWLDTGDLDEAAALWTAEFEALTTNNTLLNKEVQKGQYDALMGEAAAAIRTAVPGLSETDLLLEIGFVLNARHGLRLVERFDAMVSVELHTALADDVARTVAYGRRLHAICPERFYVKVPLSPAGLLGARRLAAAGVPVNLTLGFSARQNYLAALLARPAYVNVFMGRLNAFVADNHLGDGRNVGEKATLASQRQVSALRAAGRTPARLIGASMRAGAQVGALAGVDVYTMPPQVAAQYHAAPLPAVPARADDDPAVTTAPGVAPEDFAAGTLWEVTPVFQAAVDELTQAAPDRLTPDELVARLEHAAFGDVFPRWSAVDRQTAAADGKIPVFGKWRDRLAAGAIGLDALMNLSAFHSFATDQAALDARIAAHLR